MKKKLRITAFSDIHGYLDKDLKDQSGDLLLICGDILPLDCQRDDIEAHSWMCNKFFPWLHGLHYKKKIFIAGNHDFLLYNMMTDRNGQHRKPSRVKFKLAYGIWDDMTDITYLQDSGLDYEGYHIWGMPWIEDLTRWAFYTKDLGQYTKKMPKNLDILMTHMPPRVLSYGTSLDLTGIPNYGSQVLADAVLAEKKPRFHIFGHVHSGSHILYKYQNTYFQNVSWLNEQYQPTFGPSKFILDDQEVHVEDSRADPWDGEGWEPIGI